MDIAGIRAQLEKDRAWREDELRFFQNLGAQIETEDERDKFRRVLILLLYAHFEGFCKFAFIIYINEVNKLGLTCGEANYALAAASLKDLFHALRDPMKACQEFKNSLPDDKKLHLFARDREFVERSSHISTRPLAVPEDIVDTESNLKPVVLRKNLFRLGFKYDQFQELEGEINRLLEFRNRIAHGAAQDGIKRETYETLRIATTNIVSRITLDIMEGLQAKSYMRSNEATVG